MDRLRRDRATQTRRFRLEELRAAEPDSTQVVIGLVLVVAALVGLVYTFGL